MKKFLTIIILNLCFISSVQADDIRDFQIEGMSIGDSLLDFMSEKEIKDYRRNYLKGKREYYVVARIDNLETYEVVDLYLKTGDQKYLIRTIGGFIFHDKNMCFPKKKQIVFELEKMFPNIKKEEGERAHDFDKSKKSRQHQTTFFLKKTKKKNDPHIRVECTVWSEKIKKKNNFDDSLNVVAMTTEILNWIYNGYK